MGHGKPGKSWNVSISISRPGKLWNLVVGHEKSWKIVVCKLLQMLKQGKKKYRQAMSENTPKQGFFFTLFKSGSYL